MTKSDQIHKSLKNSHRIICFAFQFSLILEHPRHPRRTIVAHYQLSFVCQPFSNSLFCWFFCPVSLLSELLSVSNSTCFYCCLRLPISMLLSSKLTAISLFFMVIIKFIFTIFIFELMINFIVWESILRFINIIIFIFSVTLMIVIVVSRIFTFLVALVLFDRLIHLFHKCICLSVTHLSERYCSTIGYRLLACCLVSFFSKFFLLSEISCVECCCCCGHCHWYWIWIQHCYCYECYCDVHLSSLDFV